MHLQPTCSTAWAYRGRLPSQEPDGGFANRPGPTRELCLFGGAFIPFETNPFWEKTIPNEYIHVIYIYIKSNITYNLFGKALKHQLVYVVCCVTAGGSLGNVGISWSALTEATR